MSWSRSFGGGGLSDKSRTDVVRCMDLEIDMTEELMEELGDCFVASAKLLLDVGVLWREDGTVTEEWALCHGEPVLQRPPFCRFGHAWLESPCGSWALDVSQGKRALMPRPLYYAIGQIEESDVIRYTVEEARRHVLDKEHWGPWESHLLEGL